MDDATQYPAENIAPSFIGLSNADLTAQKPVLRRHFWLQLQFTDKFSPINMCPAVSIVQLYILHLNIKTNPAIHGLMQSIKHRWSWCHFK